MKYVVGALQWSDTETKYPRFSTMYAINADQCRLADIANVSRDTTTGNFGNTLTSYKARLTQAPADTALQACRVRVFFWLVLYLGKLPTDCLQAA